jgi:hypothetical protein
MLTANEYLANILLVLTKIDGKISNQQSTFSTSETNQNQAATSGLGMVLKDLLVNPQQKAKDIGALGDALKSLATGITKFSLVPQSWKTSVLNFMRDLSTTTKDYKMPELTRSLDNLSKGLWQFYLIPKPVKTTFIDFLKSFEKVNSEKLASSTKNINILSKDISNLFLSIGGAVGLIAGALWAGGKLLGVSPLAVLGALTLSVATIAGMFWILSKAGPSIKTSAETTKNMGKALMYVSGGILAFVIAWQSIAYIIGTGNDIKGLGIAAGVIVGTITAFAGIFWLLGKGDDGIKKGANAAKSMGVGLLFLSGGLLAVAGIIQLFTKLDKPLKTLLEVGLITGALVGIFYLMGKFWKEILIGTGVMLAFSLGVFALSLALKPLVDVANLIESMKNPGKTFATLGLVVASMVGIFAILGIPAVAGLVALGAAVVTAMVVPFLLLSTTLNQFATATKQFMDIASTYDVNAVKPTVKTLIGGVLGGFMEAIEETMTGGKKGWGAVKEALKNTTAITAGIGLLMGVSISLSQFARALTAFADLGNMRVIEGTDNNGKPIFGEKIDVIEVGRNITSTISTFLSGLIDSTNNLTNKKGPAIRKMARALTGKRGMLSAVIGFADAIKIYSEFGNDNTIIGVESIDTGNVDQDGNPIYEEKRTSISVNAVVNNMVSSFSTFVNVLADNVDNFSKIALNGPVKKTARLLTGKRGILSAVIGFSEALQTYSKFGEDNKIPVIGEDGNQRIGSDGKPMFVSMEQVANNIVRSLSTFSDVLSTAIDKEDRRNAGQARKTLKQFDDLIEQFNKLATAQSGLEKVAGTIGTLATNIGLLSTNLNSFSSDKLATLSNATIAANTSIANEGIITDRALRISSSSPTSNIVNNYNTSSNVPTSTTQNSQTVEPDWDKIANKIGLQVGSQLANALRNGQIKFEFSHDKSGIVTFG